MPGDKIAYDEFRVGESKRIFDDIDTVLAGYCGLTEAELDFILNDDIRCRLGRRAEEED